MSENLNIQNPERKNPFRQIARILTVVFFIQALVPLIVLILNRSHPVFVGGAGVKLIILTVGFIIYYIGLLLGFIREGLGGLLSLSSLLVMYFYAIVFVDLGEGIWLMSMAILYGMVPCLLYLLSWNVRRRLARMEDLRHEQCEIKPNGK